MIEFACATLLFAVAFIGYMAGHQDGTKAAADARFKSWLKK